MNFIQKKQLKQNLDGMKKTTGDCISILEHFKEHGELTEEQSEAIASVIDHQHNMVVFFEKMTSRV